ncbi:MAG: hypothetical protein J7K73_00770 [Nanoarchaeota archaeon]|nr:hypothetical protein [Nanoarchaeota archaeon]
MIEFSKDSIRLNRPLTKLDIFVIKFLSILDSNDINYVLVSGYVPILFGRTRMTEDVDVLTEKLSFDKFKELVSKILENGFWCLNTNDINEMYDMLIKGLSVRFSKKDEVIPNIEMRFIKTEIDKYAIKNKVKVKLEKHFVVVSPLELQIAYKLFLGSDKDIEDARYLFKLFEEHLNKQKINEFARILNVTDKVKYLE